MDNIDCIQSKKYVYPVTDMPVGIISLSAYIKKHVDVEVKLIDFNVELNKIKDFEDDSFLNMYVNTLINEPDDYDVIGISCLFSTMYSNMIDIANIVKSSFRNSIIIAGGGIPTNAYKKIFKETNAFDALCFGEGEKPLLELFKAENKIEFLESNSSWVTGEKIKNNEIYKYDFINDLDEIPFYDYDLLDIESYISKPTPQSYFKGRNNVRLFYYLTSRGCPHKCLSGNTLINTIYGKISIKEIVNNYKTIPVLTYDRNTKKILFADAINIQKIEENVKIIRVFFDNDTYIDCTPDHKFLTFKNNNQFVQQKEVEIEAQYLKSKQSVRAIKTYTIDNGYVDICCGRRYSEKYHRLVAQYKYKRKIEKNEEVHHLDYNKHNNHPDNLIIVKQCDHLSKYHPEFSERMKKNNPSFNFSKEYFINLGKLQKGKIRSEEAKINYRNSKLGSLNPNYIEFTFNIEENLNDILYAKNLREYANSKNISKELLLKYFKIKYKTSIENYRKILGIKKFQLNEINHKVVKIEWLEKKEDTYCMEVPGYNWFFANDVLVHNCCFCASGTVHGRKMRFHSIDRVKNDFDILKNKYNVEIISFQDDHLMAKKERLEEIMEYAKKIDLKLFFQTGVTLKSLDRKMLEVLKDHGFTDLVLPMESGSERVLRDIIHKPADLTMARQVAKDCRELDIFTTANIIIGLPGETRQDIEDTKQFLKSIDVNWFKFLIATPLIGSEFFKICVDKKYLDEDFIGGDFKNAVVDTEEFTKEEIEKLVYDLNLEINFVENSDMRLNNFEKAFERFKGVIKVKNDHAFAHYFAAKCCEKLNLKDEYLYHKNNYENITANSFFWAEYALTFDLENLN
jgi:radical SAM superfamily enzyme YgiQ (UPF0313 family)